MQKILGITFFLLMPVVSAQTSGMTVHGLSLLQESPLLESIKQNKDEVTTFTDSADIRVSNDNSVVTLTGGAQIRRNDAILKGDSIVYNRQTGEVSATGNARMLREGSLVVAPSLRYNVDKKTGMITSPVYKLVNGGSGEADYAELVDDNHVRLGNATYSACNCDNKFWYIKSKQVDLYDDENEGIAEDGTLYIKGIPVLWSPYLSFPIKSEKKTGWLAPTFSSTSRSGLGLSVPYFINLAPNYDLTLSPHIYSKRGAMLEQEFRYIMPSFQGELSGSFMPHDRKNRDKRWSLNWKHQHQLGTLAGLNFGLNINIQAVSDVDYYRDFGRLLISQAQSTSLPKGAAITFSGYQYWSGYLAWQKYQGLHDLTSDNPTKYQYYYEYEREPELMVRGQRFDWYGFDVDMQNTITRFTFPKSYRSASLIGRGGNQMPTGERYISYTQISYPIVRAGWYITPKVGLHASHYHTNWHANGAFTGYTSQAGTQYKSQSRVLPIVSVDAGMTFERTTTLFGKPRLQTLEPRLYYVYIPDKDQSHIPVYDTALSDFNFGTAFTENRYVGGWDRINDANQLTVGLTSRWYDEDTAKERMALQIAQRFYFSKQKVSIANTERLRLSNRSELLLNGSAALTDTLQIEAGAQFDTYGSKVAQTYSSIRWFPKRLTSVSLTHRYQQDPFLNGGVPYLGQLKGRNTISVAAQWPLSDTLYLVGRHDYAIKEKRSTQSLLGVEYKGKCCWTSRLVFQRYAVSTEKANTAIYFQLELSGLGSVGSDSLELLRESIPGYQKIKEPQTVQSPFERYE